MTEQMIERCLERLSICKTTDVMNFDYAGTLAYIKRLQEENAELRERLKKAVELPFFQKDGEVIVVIYKDKGGIVCAEEYIEDEFYDGIKGFEAAEVRLAELKGEEE